MAKPDCVLTRIELGADPSPYNLTFRVKAPDIDGSVVVNVPRRDRASRHTHKRIEDLTREGLAALRRAGLLPPVSN